LASLKYFPKREGGGVWPPENSVILGVTNFGSVVWWYGVLENSLR